MQNSKKRIWLIGLYTIVILALLVVFYNYLKGQNIFRTVNYYYVYFDNVEGLYKSNKVLLNGMRVGDVSNMQMAGDNSGRILVQIQIPKTQRIMQHTTATIINTGLVGGRVVRLDNAFGQGPYLEDGDTIRGAYQLSYAEIMEQEFMPMLKSGDSLVQQVKDMIGWLHQGLNEETRADIAAVVKNAKNSSEDLQKLLRELPSTLGYVEGLMGDLRSTSAQANETLLKAASVADSISAMGLGQLSQQFDSVLGSINHLTTRLAQPNGSLGRLMNSDTIYNQLERSVRHLDSLLVDVKRNPKRYVKFSVF